MDMLKTIFGEIDLDDDETYNRIQFRNEKDYFNGTNEELWDKFIAQVGFVYMYTHHFNDITHFKDQWNRVVLLCNEWAAKQHEMRWNNTPEGNRWFQKMLMKLIEETENMC